MFTSWKIIPTKIANSPTHRIGCIHTGVKHIKCIADNTHTKTHWFATYQKMSNSFKGYIMFIIGNFHTGENLLKYHSGTIFLYIHFSFINVHSTIFITSYKLLLSICIVLNRIFIINYLVSMYCLSDLLITLKTCHLLHIMLTVKHHTSAHMNIQIQIKETHHYKYKTYQIIYRDGL